MPYHIDEGKTGLLLDEETPSALAALMARMLEDETLRHTTAARRAAYLEKYSWDAALRRIAGVIGG